MIAPPPAHVLRTGIEALDVVTRLATAADERQVIVSAIARGVTDAISMGDGSVELRVRIDVDTLQAIEDAAEVALPEPTPL